jgi:hypothetical protein
MAKVTMTDGVGRMIEVEASEIKPAPIGRRRDHLDDTRARLADVRAELARMPAVKRGTAWHLDRVREESYLAAVIRRTERHRAESN